MRPNQFHGPKDYLDAALDPNATADELRELASSEYDFVRVAVAKHIATPADALSGLFNGEAGTWNQQALLLHLAENPNTPVDILEAIASLIPGTLHDRDAHQAFGAAVALFRRQDVPTGVLLSLLRDARTTSEFRKVVARETTRRSVLEFLTNDRSERVRGMATRRDGGGLDDHS